MALLGWVPFPAATAITSESLVGLTPQQTSSSSLAEVEQPRFVHNTSGRFESRWSAVKVEASPSIFLKDMQGSTLGVWVAHGEGRVLFPNASHLALVEEQGLAPLRYVDDDNQITEAYPFNPNGSPHGIAALCSSDGRHLALMPHPGVCECESSLVFFFISSHLTKNHPTFFYFLHPQSVAYKLGSAHIFHPTKEKRSNRVLGSNSSR